MGARGHLSRSRAASRGGGGASGGIDRHSAARRPPWGPRPSRLSPPPPARHPGGHRQPAGHRAALLTASPCLRQEREAPSCAWLPPCLSAQTQAPGAAQPHLQKAHAHCRPRTWGCGVSGGTPGMGTRQRESSRSPEGCQEHPPPREEPLRPSQDTRPRQATLDMLSHRPFPSLCSPGLSAGRGSLRVEPVWHPGPAVRV